MNDDKKMYLLDILSGKWKLLIIEDLFESEKHFNELKKDIQGISGKVLTDNLQYLMKRGIIKRKTYPVTPVKTIYYLSDTGKKVQPMLNSIYEWSIENYVAFNENAEDDFYMIFKI